MKRSHALPILVAAIALAFGPVSVDHRGGTPLVWAKDNGGDHGSGGDHGGDHGGGKGDSGKGDSAAGGGVDSDKDTAANGSKGKSSSTKGSKGKTASGLGALNAAHASPRAFAHAAPNSRVGRIATYKASLATLKAANTSLANAQATLAADIKAGALPGVISADEAAVKAAQSVQSSALANTAQALSLAANKTVTTSTVKALDTQLGVKIDATTTAAIAQETAALQH